MNNQIFRWTTGSTSNMKKYLAILLLAGCGGGGGSNNSNTETIDDVVFVKNIPGYRDNSQCQSINLGNAKVVSKHSSAKSNSLNLDIEELLDIELSELEKLFDFVKADADREIDNISETLATLDESLKKAIEEQRQILEQERANLQALAANTTSAPYPSNNFLNEPFPNHDDIPNQNFFDQLQLHQHKALEEGQATLALTLTDAEGVALDKIDPDGILVEGFDELGKKVKEFNKFKLSNILAELNLGRNALAVGSVNDYSGSMAFDLDKVEASLRLFFEIYPDSFITEIIKFTEDTMIFYPLGEANGEEFTNALARRPELGLTAIYDAVTTGIVDICKTEGYKAILLLTDGQDNSSVVSLDQTIAFAQANNVPIFSIGFGFANKDVLSRLTSETGGAYIYFPYIIYLAMNSDPTQTAYPLMSNLLAFRHLITLDDIPEEVKYIRVSIDNLSQIKTSSIEL